MNNLSLFLGAPSTRPFIYVLLIADLVLRGFALYKSAQKEQKIWFIALLIVNSLGVLPLIYLLTHKGVTKPVVLSGPKKTKVKSKR